MLLLVLLVVVVVLCISVSKSKAVAAAAAAAACCGSLDQWQVQRQWSCELEPQGLTHLHQKGISV
jgi:hypothetical protein